MTREELVERVDEMIQTVGEDGFDFGSCPPDTAEWMRSRLRKIGNYLARPDFDMRLLTKIETELDFIEHEIQCYT